MPYYVEHVNDVNNAKIGCLGTICMYIHKWKIVTYA